MAKTWCGTLAQANAGVAGAGTVRYFRIFGDMVDAATATQRVLTTWRGAGVLSTLCVWITANTRTSTTQLQLYINGVATGPIINVVAAATGYATFGLTDTQALADGDTVCLRVLNGAGAGGSVTIKSITFAFEGASGVTSGMQSLVVDQLVTSQSVFFGVVSGTNMGGSGSEAAASPPAGVPGTWTNINAVASTNTFTLGLDLLLRKNTADTALLVNLPTLSVGPVEDTTNNATIAIGDTFCFSARRAGAGSGSVNLANLAARFTSTGSGWELISSYLSSISQIVTSSDSFYPVLGDASQDSLTEADVQLPAPYDMYVTNLRAKFGGTATLTPFGLTLRVNGVDTALSANFPTSVSNADLQNNTASVFVQKGDLLSLKCTAGSAAARIMNFIALVIDTAPPPATLTGPAVFTVPAQQKSRRSKRASPFTSQTIQFINNQRRRPPFVYVQT